MCVCVCVCVCVWPRLSSLLPPCSPAAVSRLLAASAATAASSLSEAMGPWQWKVRACRLSLPSLSWCSSWVTSSSQSLSSERMAAATAWKTILGGSIGAEEGGDKGAGRKEMEIAQEERGKE